MYRNWPRGQRQPSTKEDDNSEAENSLKEDGEDQEDVVVIGRRKTTRNKAALATAASITSSRNSSTGVNAAAFATNDLIFNRATDRQYLMPPIGDRKSRRVNFKHGVAFNSPEAKNVISTSPPLNINNQGFEEEQSSGSSTLYNQNRPNEDRNSELQLPSILKQPKSKQPTSKAIKESEKWTSPRNDDEKTKFLTELEVDKVLGNGRFSQVLLAKSPRMKRVFALKMIPIVDVVKNSHIESVHIEKDTLLSVQSSLFFCQLFLTHHDQRFLYMLLEFVAGGELRTLMSRHPTSFDMDLTVFYASEILCALEYLHSLGLVYVGLEPKRILLARNGHIKLVNLGDVCKPGDKIERSIILGLDNWMYIAPELVLGLPVDFSSDFWSLGVLIVECLTRSLPFDDDYRDALFLKIKSTKKGDQDFRKIDNHLSEIFKIIKWPQKLDLKTIDFVSSMLFGIKSKQQNIARRSQRQKHLINKNFDNDHDDKATIESDSFSKSHSLPRLNEKATLRKINHKYDSRLQKPSFSDYDQAQPRELSNITPIFMTELEYTIPLEMKSSLRSRNLDCKIKEQLENKMERYRSGCSNVGEIMRHVWFKGIEWRKAREGRLLPPVVPPVDHEADTQNFEPQDLIDFRQASLATNAQLLYFAHY